MRMLFIDYSSVFNTIVPSKLVIKLETLGLDPALCNWVLDFLTGHPQVVRVVNNPLIRGVEMLLPTLTTWGRPVRKSSTQLHNAGSRPRVSSLMTSLEGTMVLNTEL